MFDYLIIGAGVTGITLCKKLREKGIENIAVLEAGSEVGGLCKTKNIDGNILDIGGGHFFHTKHQEIFDYIFKYLPKEEFNYYKRVSKIEIENATIDYPIESNIWQLPMKKQVDYIISVIRNGEAAGTAEPHNYEEWIRWKLGNKICDNYMIPYNEKLWGVSPSEMDIDWLYKIPRVDVEEVLQYCLERRQDVNKFPAHVHFFYPKRGGFQRIVDAIAKDEMDKILLDVKVDKLEFKEGRWIINGLYEARNVINTAPWKDLYAALGSPAELEDAFSKIRYNRIVVSLCEHEYEHDWHWRYIPDMTQRHHREFYIKNFAQDSKKNNIYIETSLERHINKTGKQNYGTAEDFCTDAAYPIPVIGHHAAINKILQHYKSRNLFGVGRWGQHEYQNADVSMYEAIKFVDRL